MRQGKPKVLIVDDAGPMVVLCVNVLQSGGYLVKGANSAERAIELVRQEPFDLMLVDYVMPDMNGFKLFKEVREIHPELASVLMTAHGTPELVREATQLGFNSVLSKPFTPDELRGAVKNALAGRP